MVIPLVCATIVGIMVGVEFAVAVFLNPILRRLPIGSSIAARADGARVLGRVMPFWYLGSLVLTVILAVTSWGTRAGNAAGIASMLLVISVVMSIALLVPINARTATWTERDHPADWREQLARWELLHVIRVAVIGVAFVLILFALAVD